jgi:hypothetical protein
MQLVVAIKHTPRGIVWHDLLAFRWSAPSTQQTDDEISPLHDRSLTLQVVLIVYF